MNHDALVDLLYRTSSAHGAYETTALNGVYDESWAIWYADWAIRNGLNSLLGTKFTAADLGLALTDLNEEHKKATTAEDWAQFTARRLVETYRQA
jgi:hypothetical protein